MLLFYCLIYIYIIKSILMMDNIKIKRIYLSFIIAFFAYSLFEKVIIFSTGYASVFFTIFLVGIPGFYRNGGNKLNERK